MFKKIICFLMLLIPWFVSSILFPFDAGFYNSLYLPKITPPKFVFVIIWPILFILITITRTCPGTGVATLPTRATRSETTAG